MDKRYLYAREDFVSVSLVDGRGGIVKNSVGDFTSGTVHELYCPLCKKQLTVKQFKDGRLKLTDDDTPENIYQHIKCPK